MGVKDWKKIGNTNSLASWKNKDKMIFISKGFNNYIFSMYKEGHGYLGSQTRNFKTKSQALAHARAYMRKH